VVINQGSVVNNIADKIGAAAFVFPTIDVNLRKGSYDSSIIVHELGHVLDNSHQSGVSGFFPATFVGGGPADAMVRAMGGNPSACAPRLQCWSGVNEPQGYAWYWKNVAGNSRWSVTSYANNGVSDDFAETFRWTILTPNLVPAGRYAWMQEYLSQLP
jgi:hypothetical protein